MTLLFEEATPFGLKIFVTVSIFSIFLMYIQIPSKQRPDQTIFVLRNVVFFPRWPGGVGPEENDHSLMRR